MSRFFRSATSTSSSDTDPDDDSDEELDDVSISNDGLEKLGTVSANAEPLPSTASDETAARSHLTLNAGNVAETRPIATDHRDFLLHALLEERCLNETLASQENFQHSRDSPEIQAQARAKYQRISTQLASLNLLSSGLANDSHARTRQRYRSGLDILSQSSSTAVPLRLRRLLTDSEAEIDTHRLAANERFAGLDRDVAHHPPALPYPLRRLITGTEAIDERSQFGHSHTAKYPLQNGSHHVPEAILGPSLAMGHNGVLQPRYFRDFEELSLLGKGGYGVVYRARHLLDNQSYAIKKVPLGPARLKRIRDRGQSEVDEVMRELRTLALLDHPNIVRYHTSWIEWTNASPSTKTGQSSVDSGLTTASEDAVLGAQNEFEPTHSDGRLATTTRSEHFEILFEESHGRSKEALNETVSERSAANLTMHSPSPRGANRSIETAESVNGETNRAARMPLSFEALSNYPTLVLHMQMSLHPMSLAEYLAPISASTDPHAPPPLSHCFHLEPSVSILQAILNGVEYLHDKGMVHRDIKPANIFIGTKGASEATYGLTCTPCRAQRKATPVALDVRIGDFGLVTLGQSTDANSSRSKAVGTELYRSATAEASSHQLDIYALGIVAFELLWQFETRMERLHVIKRLKEGEFPKGFSDGLGKHGEDVSNCIRSMISANGADLSIRDIKQVLADLQKTFH